VTEDAKLDEAPPVAARSAPRDLWKVAAVVLIAGAAHALAFRPALSGSTALWWWLLGSYGLLAALALHHFWTEGTLVDRLQPRGGDVARGVGLFVLLLFASFVARSTLAPSDTPRYAWLYRLYLKLGDPEIVQHSAALTVALLSVAVLEELVWRGLVLDVLSAELGARRGWIASTLAYTASTIPTLFALRDPIAGLNPLLPTAALGAGLVWSFAAARFGRLPPVMISHMAFSYFSVVQFRWPGL
jgi:membrane protease YdiL (CAAX protease family)